MALKPADKRVVDGFISGATEIPERPNTNFVVRDGVLRFEGFGRSELAYIDPDNFKIYWVGHGGNAIHDSTHRYLKKNVPARMFDDSVASKRGLRPNFLFSKKPKTPEEEEQERVDNMRRDRVWRDKFNYYRVSEGRSQAVAEKLADEAYEAYWAKKKRLAGKEASFHRNPSPRIRRSRLDREDFDTSDGWEPRPSRRRY